MNKVFEKISRQCIALYRKEAAGMPKWGYILEALIIAEKEPTFENIKYVNLLYHGLNDLLSPIYQFWLVYDHLDDEKGSVTVSQHRLYTNRMGIEIVEPITFYPEQYKSSFLGKTLEELNRKPTTYKQLKISNYRRKSENETDWYFNETDIEDGIVDQFKELLNPRILKCSFEEFITFIEEEHAVHILTSTHEYKEVLMVDKGISVHPQSDELQQSKTTSISPNDTFDSLFDDEKKKMEVIQLMLHFQLMDRRGNCLIGEKEKSKLLAFAHALRLKFIIQPRANITFSTIFNNYLGLKDTELRSSTEVYKKFYREINSYLNQ